MPTTCLIDILRNHVQALDIIHDPEAKSIKQQFQTIQHLIARNIIVLMNKHENFDSGKYAHLVTELKAFYQAISVYQSKLAHKPPFTSGGIINSLFPRKTSYQPLLRQQYEETERADEEATQAAFHCDKMKQAIEECLPKLSKMTMCKRFLNSTRFLIHKRKHLQIV